MCVLGAVVVFTGCSSPRTETQVVVAKETQQRPARVLVHDFIATPADIPPDAPIGARVAFSGSFASEQIALDRKLGADMAAQLVTAIRAMGLPAERALPGTTPQVNDVLIRGYLASIHPDNAAQPVTLGFDFGAPELTTVIESFQITAQGLGRALGSGVVTAEEKAFGAVIGSSSNPTGYIIPKGIKIDGQASARAKVEGWAGQSVKEIAERLKARFQEKGWIN